ncbi:hypothetical protein Tco_1358217, partial [Tanacetum coccineum]
AIRQAYLDGTHTKSEPFEEPVDTETPESPYTVAPPTSLPESTPPTLVPILRRTARMAVCVPPAMSLGLSASMAGVAAMFESAFHAEDEGPTAEDEDPAAGDEGLAARDEGPDVGVESRGLDDESHSLDDESRGLDDAGHGVESDGLGLRDEEEAVLESQQLAVPVVGTIMSAPLGLGYGALRLRELALEEDQVYNTFEVGHGSGSTPEPERPERVSTSRQPTLTTCTDLEDDMVYIDVPLTHHQHHLFRYHPHRVVVWFTYYFSSTFYWGLIRDHKIRLEKLSPALFKRYDRDIRELFTRSGVVRDEIFSQRYRFKSLKHEKERVVVTFEAIWRLVLALESWTGQTDAQRAALWHAISDTHGENWELRLQLAKERRAQLKPAEIVDSMRRGQEPRGDV